MPKTTQDFNEFGARFNPVRAGSESLTEYRQRQQSVRSEVREMTRPVADSGPGTLSNALKNKVRKLKAKMATEKRRKGLPPLTTPKPVPTRKHKQHTNPRRADGFAITLIGSERQFIDCNPGPGWFELGRESAPTYTVIFARRIWLAGVSAQRGY